MNNKNNPAGNPAALDARAVLRRRLLGTALAASASPLLLSACGGDDDDPAPLVSQPPPEPPPPELGAPKSTVFTVKDRKILLNGKEFFAKGMCYSPVPIGAQAGAPPGGDHFSDFWEPIFKRDLSVLH
ncbi:MAG: hypothetical protein AB7E55_14610, partial [Pigmentiphaga sp.]